jgi:hypothetical protein
MADYEKLLAALKEGPMRHPLGSATPSLRSSPAYKATKYFRESDTGGTFGRNFTIQYNAAVG